MKNNKLTITILIIFATLLVGCSGSTRQFVNDSGITAEVKTKLADNPNTKARDIHVDTIDGVVRLSGVISNEKERITANEIAKKVKGVRRVDNALLLQKQTRH